MNTELNGAGMLIDPSGHHSTTITKEEACHLATCLSILRKDGLAGSMLRGLIVVSESRSHREILKTVLQRYLDNYVPGADLGNDGIICGGICDNYFTPLHSKEIDFLANALQVFNLNTWFSEWLNLQVGTIANNDTAAERFPTPLQIAASLTLDIEEYTNSLDVARAIVAERPDLIADLLPKPALVPTPKPRSKRKAA